MTETANSQSLLILGFLLWFIIIIISSALYFLPTIIAFIRKHPNRIAILVLNIFLGWTLVAWVVALVMAFWLEDRQGSQSNILFSTFPSSKPIPRAIITIPEDIGHQNPESHESDTPKILIATVASVTLVALVILGMMFFKNISDSSHGQQSATVQSGSNTVREAPSPTQSTDSSLEVKPLPVTHPKAKSLPALGRITIFRQDSQALSNPQKCHVRLRPTESSLINEDSGGDTISTFIPCGQVVDVLAYDAPFYRVQAPLQGQYAIGWIYAGTTTNWEVPANMKPSICQVMYNTPIIDASGNILQSHSGNRYVIINDIPNQETVTVLNARREQLSIPSSACEYL